MSDQFVIDDLFVYEPWEIEGPNAPRHFAKVVIAGDNGRRTTIKVQGRVTNDGKVSVPWQMIHEGLGTRDDGGFLRCASTGKIVRIAGAMVRDLDAEPPFLDTGSSNLIRTRPFGKFPRPYAGCPRTQA